MSLDGAVVSQLAHEIKTRALNARVERIAQPSRDEVIIQLRSRGGSDRLLINVSPNNSRIHFTQFPPENPLQPPMFCMLLRKHLQSARLVEVSQYSMDRAMTLSFEGYNQLGDLTVFRLIAETMGRHSNIILVDGGGHIIDSQKRIDFETSQLRQILPGLIYLPPPSQQKLNILNTTSREIIDKLKQLPDQSLSSGLISVLEGFSPLPIREISFRVTAGQDYRVSQLTADHLENLAVQLDHVRAMLADHAGTPTAVIELDGRPKDLSFIEIKQYGDVVATRAFVGYSDLLDFFYTRRDTVHRIKQKSGSLFKSVENTVKRVQRRLSAQMQELEETKHREDFRIKGDLLTANLHTLKKGDKVAVLANYYDPDGGIVEIELDSRKTPPQNAQGYYAKYRKLDTAEKKLTQLIGAGKEELEYIESILDSLKRGESEADLEAIRLELAEAGYIKRKSAATRKAKPSKLSPHRYLSRDGFTILAGRNNVQNERLTLKESTKEDIWLHAQKIPGSHIIIITAGKAVPDSTLEDAAVIAAYHSKYRDGSKVSVDYTKVKNVRKIPGGKPGMVTYEDFRTIIVDPNEEKVNDLQEKATK